MNSMQMSAALRSAFSEPTRATIVSVLHDAYRLACGRYDESIGCNSYTFGTELYHFVKFQLQGQGDPESAPVTLGETSSDLELRLQVGEFNVACHRVGSSGAQDIEECFPSSPGGPGRLARLNAVQLELDLEYEDCAQLPQNVVIAHLGNPAGGLEAVYLTVPFGVSESGRINSWAYTELVWHVDEGGFGDDSVEPRPPAVPIDDALVELRKKHDRAEDLTS